MRFFTKLLILLSFFFGGADIGVASVLNPLCKQYFLEAIPDNHRPLTHSNIFIKGLNNLDIKGRQLHALNILLKDNSGLVNDDLRKALKIKQKAYLSQVDPARMPSAEELGLMQKHTLDALEYVLRTFRTNGADDDLRKWTIKALGKHDNADTSTIEHLLQLTRGVASNNDMEVIWANEAIQGVSIKFGNDFVYVPRQMGEIRALPSGLEYEIISVKSLGGVNNVNEVAKVTLKNKSNGEEVVGVYKALAGEARYQDALKSSDRFKLKDSVGYIREVQAYDFFTKFMHHNQIQVPETSSMVLTHNGKQYGVGSFQFFAKGYQSVNDYYGQRSHLGRPAKIWQEYKDIWNTQSSDTRWTNIASWIQVFDYIMGNADRFSNTRYGGGNPNNIFMAEMNHNRSKIMVALIDNGNGRYSQEILGRENIPPIDYIDPALRDTISSWDQHFFEYIERRYREYLPPDGINDIMRRIRDVQNAITPSNPG